MSMIFAIAVLQFNVAKYEGISVESEVCALRALLANS